MIKIFEITYILDECVNYAPLIGYNILYLLKNKNCIVINFFRIKNELIDLHQLININYKFIVDKRREDNSYLFINEINREIKLIDMLRKEDYEYPAEINCITLNKSIDLYFKNKNFTNDKIIKNGLSKFILEIYDGMLILKFNKDFYGKNEEKLIELWEKDYFNLKYAKKTRVF